MRSISNGLFLTLAIALTGDADAGTVIEADYVVENVHVVPMNEEVVLPNRRVVVRGREIVAIVDQATAIDAVANKHIDGEGRYLMPGLADMHVHMRMAPQAMFNLLLANGVTTVTNMRLGDGDGKVDHLALRSAVEEGRVPGPRYLVSGPQLTPERLPDVGAVERMLNRHAEQQYDVVKIHQDLDAEVFDALLAGADRLGLRVTGHLQHQMPLIWSLRMTSVEHAEEFLYTSKEGFGPVAADFMKFMPDYNAHVERMRDSGYRAAMIREVADSSVYVNPTLVIYKMISVWADPENLPRLSASKRLSYVPEGTRNWYLDPETNPYSKEEFPLSVDHLKSNFEILSNLTFELHEAGVPLLLGTDTFGTLVPGFSLHRELGLLVAAGLTPYEALRTGTVNVAAYLGELGRAGTIEVGKRADFILTNGNPLLDIQNAGDVSGVFTHGKWYPQAELAEMLKRAAEQPEIAK